MSSFYHLEDDGKVNFFTRKCKVCGARWPIKSYFSWPLPEGLGIKFEEKSKVKYPNFLYKIPYGQTAMLVADMLPHWKRPYRILATLIFISLIVGLIVWRCS